VTRLEITRTRAGRYQIRNEHGRVLHTTSSAGAALKARARLQRAAYYRANR
jgi:hypothetical protein